MGKKGETVHFGRVKTTGEYLSRYGNWIASPVVQNGEEVLLKSKVISYDDYWNDIHWTYDVPILVKNMHRKFWGFGPALKDQKDADFHMQSESAALEPNKKKRGKIR